MTDLASLAARRSLGRSRSGAGLLPYLLVAPGTLIVAGFTVLSLSFTLFASFTDWDIGKAKWGLIGLGNYLRAAADPLLISSLIASFVFVASVVALSIAAGFIIAVALNRKFRGRALLRGLVVAPWVISELATGVFWSLLLRTDGLFGQALGGPLNSANGAMACLILVEVWRSVGFVTVMILASLQTIDHLLFEAARVDGATPLRTTWSITIPLVSPSLIIAAILLVIGNFNLVTMIIALTAGGPISATTTVALYMYQQSFVYFHIGYGASIAIVMSVINVAAMLIFMAIQRNVGMRQ
jgi:ABC-type sugar transport system permease subunit